MTVQYSENPTAAGMQMQYWTIVNEMDAIYKEKVLNTAA